MPREPITGVSGGAYWAWCNACEWKGETHWFHEEAERDRTEHIGTAAHIGAWHRYVNTMAPAAGQQDTGGESA